MRILIGGGGTGGHIYPALALARYAKSHGGAAEIIFVGSARGLESKIVPAAGYRLLTIPASGFKRSLKGLRRTVRDLLAGIAGAGKILNNLKPQVILGTGGYVAAPLIIAGFMKKYPLVLHEQNALPGLTNRLLAPFVKSVCISFAETENKLSRRAKIVFTGNPRASEVAEASRKDGVKSFGIKSGFKVLLVYGGSRGAQKLNEVVTSYIKKRLYPEGLIIIYVTGDLYYAKVKEQLKNLPEEVKLFAYLNNMPSALAAADLVLTRSGATTLAEITALGLPAILVPSPNVVNNHQFHNAKLLSDRKAALLVEEKDFNEHVLAQRVKELTAFPQKLAQMAGCSKSLGVVDAAERLYKVLREAAS